MWDIIRNPATSMPRSRALGGDVGLGAVGGDADRADAEGVGLPQVAQGADAGQEQRGGHRARWTLPQTASIHSRSVCAPTPHHPGSQRPRPGLRESDNLAHLAALGSRPVGVDISTARSKPLRPAGSTASWNFNQRTPHASSPRARNSSTRSSPCSAPPGSPTPPSSSPPWTAACAPVEYSRFHSVLQPRAATDARRHPSHTPRTRTPWS